MNGLLLLIVGIIYIGLAFSYLFEGKTGLMITFFAYALANYGLYLSGK